MEKKQRIFRITDQEHEALKAFLDKIRNKRAETKDSEEQDFLNKALMWFRAQSMLVEIGSISCVPNIFKTSGQQIIGPTGIVSVVGNDTTELPAFVEDILNGGTYPNREDCTQEEAAILYDAKFKALYKAFFVAKNDMARQNIKQSMVRLVGEIRA